MSGVLPMERLCDSEVHLLDWRQEATVFAEYGTYGLWVRSLQLNIHCIAV